MLAEAQGQMTSQPCLGLTLTVLAAQEGTRSPGNHLSLQLGSRVGSMLSRKCSRGSEAWGTEKRKQTQVTAQVRREGGEEWGESRSQKTKFRMLKVKLF